MAIPIPAAAFELNGGVSLGVVAAGVVPRLAVSPHAGISWRMQNGLLFAFHEVPSILLATNEHGPGIYNQASADVGYAWEDFNVSLGPSFALYSIPACSKLGGCWRVEGAAPGAHVQASLYFAGPLGVSIWGSLDWLGGESSILPGDLTAMFVAGPVLRWRTK